LAEHIPYADTQRVFLSHWSLQRVLDVYRKMPQQSM